MGYASAQLYDAAVAGGGLWRTECAAVGGVYSRTRCDVWTASRSPSARCGKVSSLICAQSPAAYDCGSHHDGRSIAASQVVFAFNRYSVPVELAQKHLVLKAYPFHIEILTPTVRIAHHAAAAMHGNRTSWNLPTICPCWRNDWRFEHATPMRQCPVAAGLRRSAGPVAGQSGRTPRRSKSRAVRSFIQTYVARRTAARSGRTGHYVLLAVGMAHLEGVTFCLHRLLDPAPTLPTAPGITTRQLMALGAQPLVVTITNS
ncbi:MAG: hypothetical protein R3A44_00615 [Caldilineaceae bacterium]